MMKKKNRHFGAYLLSAGVLTASFLNPLISFAEPSDSGNGSRLIDSRRAAEYLLLNKQETVLKREPIRETGKTFPETFDLREFGYVTPVKNQSPWGTCWGFSVIAAAESSILSEAGKTYEETGLDLSEHHLAYFARTYMNDGASQDGEGICMYEGEEMFDTGGMLFTGTSVFSSGMGVVTERLVPYRGRNSSTYADFTGKNLMYSPEDDWSIPDSFKFIQSYELENSDILPSPPVYAAGFDGANESDVQSRENAYLGYDQSATDIMKQALMDGRAISLAFSADTYLPGFSSGEPRYLNTSDNKWTHFTYDGGAPNHAVTIVGWDDTVKSTDFLDHSNDRFGDGLPHQPEGDGAWIVKNSWGADTEVFPNAFTWGLENEDGKSTGYFYLSYYDRSLSVPEIFDFDADTDRESGYIIDQYDYLQTTAPSGWADKNELKTANVFTAEFDEKLRAVSCETEAEDTTVDYEIFLLDEQAQTPEDGQRMLTAQSHYAHAGYHRLELEKTVDIKKGQKYAVVVTQQLRNSGERYYGVPIVYGYDKKSTDEMNRILLASGSGIIGYYSKGVVNPGESYVYIGQLDGWSDFSSIIPILTTQEAFEGVTFDNFPIKAYLDYTDETDIDAAEAYTPPELGYAEPAGARKYSVLIKEAALVLIVAALLVKSVWSFFRNRKRKKLIRAQQAEIEELRARLAQTTEN